MIYTIQGNVVTYSVHGGQIISLYNITEKGQVKKKHLWRTEIKEETRSTRDHQYSGRPRVTTPKQDRENRLTRIQNRFRSDVQTAVAIHGRHFSRKNAKTVCRRLHENYIRLRRTFIGPVQDNRRQRL